MKKKLTCIGFLMGISAWAQCTPPVTKITGKSTGQPITLSNFISSTVLAGPIYAMNMDGSISWVSCNEMTLTRPATPTTVLTLGIVGDYQVQELNVAGGVVWSVSMANINAQLGSQKVIDFNHEAIRLPNGWTAIGAHVEQLISCASYPAQCGGSTTGTVDVVGSSIVVVDQVGTVRWFWNPYVSFDLSRPAVLGEHCTAAKNNGGCPIKLASVANDWMHGNSLYFNPTDGNFLFNLRDQDWAVYIDFANGLGDGHVIWRLGQGGDFAMLNTPGITSPWFTHAHDITMTATGSWKFTVYDNGNTRYAADPTAHSRGQALTVNVAKMQADIAFNVDLGVYSPALGTSELLSNGNYWFMSGRLTNASNGKAFSQGAEYTPQGKLVCTKLNQGFQYRGPRLANLFSLN